jgi:hypothetical protein
MKKLIAPLILSLLIVFTFSCKKDEETPEPAAIVTPTPTPPVVTEDPNTNPALLMTLPGQNLTFSVGSYVKVEGIATDAEGLKGIVCVGTANDYYNYTFTDTIFISGTNTVFTDSVFIPDNISPGNLDLQFFAIDLIDSTSNIINRSEITYDNINPTLYYNTTSVNELDSIIVTVYRNSFNLVDSIDIFNQTTGQTMGSLKDNIGFQLFNFVVSDYVTSVTTSIYTANLYTNTSTSHHKRVPLKNSFGNTYTKFRVGLDEIDYTPLGGGKNYYGMVFDIN